MTIPRRSSRRAYDRVVDSNGGDTESTTNNSTSRRNNNRTGLNEPLAPSQDDASTSGGSTSSSRVVVSTSPPPSTPRTPLVSSTTTQSSTITTTQPPIYNQINITVLDSAQTKFNIPCDASWTVSDFKTVSATVHKIIPKSQRLIYMGKLLSDDAKTLKEYGIEEDGKIVHLFPKPNIVMVTPSASAVEGGDEENEAAGGTHRRSNSSSSGAHVPQIILDAEEANRQTQIRILSSHEIFEAQNRVKLLSFLLLIVCSMELLTLFTIFLGVPTEAPVDGSHSGYDDDAIPPGDPTDTNPHPGGSGGDDDFEVRTWRQSDYADLCISSFGFYVATLGIKATTENTLTLARQYFCCLVVVGVAWSAHCFYVNVKTQEDAMERHNNPNGDYGEDTNQEISGDIYTNAMFTTMLPLFVWLICFLRAWQFQTLIQEAEREAEERLGGLTAGGGEDQEEEGMVINPSAGERGGGVDLEDGGGTNLNVSSSPNNVGDLELIVEQRDIT